MGSRYEVEVTVASARDLKNVNWRYGDLKPYAVVWVDSGAKSSTRVDLDNGETPNWDEKLVVPLPPASRIDDAVLYIDVVHANAAEGVKPLVGSARLPLRDVLDDAGLGGRASRNLRLKRPSGRPHGRLDVRVAVKEPSRYYDPSPYPAPAYSSSQSRDPYGSGGGYGSAGGYGAGGGYGYGAAQPYTAAPPAGYPSTYGSAPPPPQPAYGAPPAPAYGAAPAQQAAYGAAPAVQDPNKKNSKMGMGTGLAVGAAAGVLGGLALAGGASFLENKMEEHVADRVEDNLERENSYGGGYGGGYDDDDGDY
ncbi:protein SRC2 homolog isoform X2 [Phragmites australis]|uniref:protein SRC2 homolog isoform X2 n=1 Tax=Phragmites australis TaxID=29695 RepID=UPI002D78DD30|nr:protein SRC2 homolog isoform X2 [Phragmites australis]